MSSRRRRTRAGSRSSGFPSSCARRRSRSSRFEATTSAPTGRSNVYRRALAAGIEIHLPRYQPRSTLTLGACLWAGDEGRLRDFKHALYEAFFCEGLDIATDAEIGRAAERAGLDPVGAVAAAYDHARGARLREIRAEAEAAGVAGVPTLLTADGRTHWGMGGVERLLADEPLVPRR